MRHSRPRGNGKGGRVEVVTDGRPLLGGRRSRAGRRRYLPVAGAVRRAAAAPAPPRHHQGGAAALRGRFLAIPPAAAGGAGRSHPAIRNRGARQAAPTLPAALPCPLAGRPAAGQDVTIGNTPYTTAAATTELRPPPQQNYNYQECCRLHPPGQYQQQNLHGRKDLLGSGCPTR